MATGFIATGKEYEFMHGGRYRVLFFAYDGVTMRENVVYVGIYGPDKGKHYTCSPWDFGIKFTLVAEPEPRPIPEKKAGIVTRSVHA